jgi:cleavage stimulation factor subunit 3
MAELFPEDPKLLQFATRYSGDGFDPTVVRPIISPAFQMRPKSTIMQSIEQIPSVQGSPRPPYDISPRPQYLQTTNSPKRPFPEDFESELNRPRKLARGESPLKGAAGRRLNEQKQARGTPQWQPNAPAPFVVPRDITYVVQLCKVY